MHLYVHIPFCARRCSYCDFSIAVRKTVPVAEYLDALRIELWRVEPSAVRTVYFGGGTPSRLGASGVERMLDVVRERYSPDVDAEITLEANPEDVTSEAARGWRSAGVNRLSLGIQSFDDRVLEWMHRVHDAQAAREAFATARDAGFDNISVDLIFALPAELRRDWRRDLDAALGLTPEHVSLYGLTIEPSTPLSRWRDRGAVVEAPEEHYEREFLQAHDTLTAAGFDHYEVSNFARGGHRSRHNSAYWTLAPYAGHGPAAHSFDGAQRRWNEPAYTRWIELLRRGESAVAGSELLSDEQRELERGYLGLRTKEGFDFTPEQAMEAARWADAGWAVIHGSRVVLTPPGWLRLDALCSVLTGNGSPCNV